MHAAPLLATALWCLPGSRQYHGLQVQQGQSASVDGNGLPPAAAALEQLCLCVGAGEGPAGASASLTGSLVHLGTHYHGGLPGRCIQLGRSLGSGGFADVFQGTVVPMNGLQLTNAQ